MNKDEATKQWIADHTLGDLKPHDGAIMCFREGYEEGYEAGYEAGQRAERVRIVFELDELLGDVGDGKLARFMDELRADPAESGE